MNEQTIQTLSTIIPDELHQSRLDKALAHLFQDYSRGQLQTWIKNDAVAINDSIINKTRYKVQTGQRIEIKGKLTAQQENWQAQPIALDIVDEDEALLIVNKPANFTVHPGAGQADHTLVNGLKHHCPQLELLPRAGLIHRLDKNTTGLLIVAKTLASYHYLTKALQARDIKRSYLALIHGTPLCGGEISVPIGRDRNHRTKMCVRSDGKSALTHYRIQEKLTMHSLLELTLDSGRTHQIRVHLAHIHHPIVGDPLYQKGYRPSPKLSINAQNAITDFKRQALHAYQLGLMHPLSQKQCQWQAPLPPDFTELLTIIRNEPCSR